MYTQNICGMTTRSKFKVIKMHLNVRNSSDTYHLLHALLCCTGVFLCIVSVMTREFDMKIWTYKIDQVEGDYLIIKEFFVLQKH